jgi:hypothetical protein
MAYVQFKDGDPRTEIARRLARVRADHGDEMRRRMDDYNREVLDPAVSALRAECGAIGHVAGSVHSSGFGTWEVCAYCGDRMKHD